MSGNYPDGVTGNEPAIAGYPEGSYSISCKGYLPEDAKVAPLDWADQIESIVDRLNNGDLDQVAFRLGILAASIMQMPKAVDVECGYEGKVEAWSSGGRTAFTVHWTCPRCGTEGEEDREVGDDDPNL